MKEKRVNEIKGVILIAISVIILASLISYSPYDLRFYTTHPNIPPKNLIRSFGAYMSGILIGLFGWASLLIPLCILWFGTKYFKNEPPYISIPRLFGLSVLLFSASSLVGVCIVSNDALRFSRAGFLGDFFSKFVTLYFGRLGGYIVFLTLIILSLALVTEILISTFLFKSIEKLHGCDILKDVPESPI